MRLDAGISIIAIFVAALGIGSIGASVYVHMQESDSQAVEAKPSQATPQSQLH